MNIRELILLALCELFNLELTDAAGPLDRLNGGKKFLALLKLTFKENACSDGTRGPFMLSSYRSMELIETADEQSERLLTYLNHSGEWPKWPIGAEANRTFTVKLTPKFYFKIGEAREFLNDFADTLEGIQVVLPQYP